MRSPSSTQWTPNKKSSQPLFCLVFTPAASCWWAKKNNPHRLLLFIIFKKKQNFSTLGSIHQTVKSEANYDYLEHPAQTVKIYNINMAYNDEWNSISLCFPLRRVGLSTVSRPTGVDYTATARRRRYWRKRFRTDSRAGRLSDSSSSCAMLHGLDPINLATNTDVGIPSANMLALWFRKTRCFFPAVGRNCRLLPGWLHRDGSSAQKVFLSIWFHTVIR